MLIVHGKNDFAAVFKNLVRYRSENNFIRFIKYLCILKLLIAKMLNFSSIAYHTCIFDIVVLMPQQNYFQN